MSSPARSSIASPACDSINWLFTLLVLTLMLFFAVETPAAAKKKQPDAAAIAVAALRGAGKLDAGTAQRLTARLAKQGKVRVMLRLRLEDPSARLSPRQARSGHARKLRRQAIARAQTSLLGRGEFAALRHIKRLRHMPVIAAEVDASTLASLQNIPEIERVQEDRLLWPSLNSSRVQLGANVAWADGFDGHDQAVAVIDTGVDALHPALAGRVIAEACFSTRSYADGTTSLCPNGLNPGGEDSQTGPGAATPCGEETFGCDHGTHVAGITTADGQLQGMAPAANIIAVQAFSRLNDFFACGFQPSCLSAYTSDVIRALEYVYDLRESYPVAAVNMSLGSGGYTSIADCEADFPFLKAAIDNLHTAGIATIVASGNDGYINALAAPACISNAFSVGAVDDFDDVAYFSNAASFLDTLAPGVDVVSTVPGGGFQAKDGTSMAAPHVAGAVAAIRSAAPDATPDEVYAAIASSGVPVNDPRSGITTPRIRIDAAIEHLIGQDLSSLDLALEPIATGLGDASTIAHAGDGSSRLFIALRSGEIVIHADGNVLAAPFLDLSGELSCCTQARLIGLAFHPEYSSNGWFYVTYTREGGELVLARYQVSADPDQALAGSQLEILSVPTAEGGPIGGSIAFGSDGYLYMATGDGLATGDDLSPANATNLGSLLGKLLRLDVDQSGPNGSPQYAIPPDNPHLGETGARPEIWAHGLHDPRGLIIDPPVGRLLIADSGKTLYEEVNAQETDSAGGENYGWNEMEGYECASNANCDPTGLKLPIGGFSHVPDCPVRGGAVNRNLSQASLAGIYLFSDACSGALFGLRYDSDAWSQAPLLETPLAIAAFGSGEDGSVYLVDETLGTLYRVTQSDLQLDTLELSQAYLNTPYSQTLSASGGTPPYQWQLAGGELPPGLALDAVNGTLSGTPTGTGTSIVTISVHDAGFTKQTRRLALSIITPPLVIDSASVPHAVIGELYDHTLQASGGQPPYSWQAIGALPVGLGLDPDGRLSGVPDEQGVLGFTVQVLDAAGESTSRTIGLRVYGPVLELPVGFPDLGAYGSGYGSNEHSIGLLARFSGGTSDLKLFFTGWDIDYTDEVAVYLNDTPIGFVSTGPNEQHNNGDLLVIAASAQRAGTNELRFEQRTNGFKWGITGLLLTDLEILTSSLPEALFGAAYGQTLNATGGRTPYSWQVVAGALPQGLVLNADGSFAGFAGAQGDFSFEVEVTDADGKKSSRWLSLRVLGETGTVELVLQPGVMNTNRYGWNYGSSQHRLELVADFVATNKDMVLGVSGFDIDYADEVELLLNGQSLGYLSVGPDSAHNAGDEFEIPAEAQIAGSNRLTFRQRTSGFKWGVTNLLLNHLRVSDTALPMATYQNAYSHSLEVTGGLAPYQWQVSSGTLPAGISLLDNGTLTGMPEEQGQFPFTARVVDADGSFANRDLVLDVIGTSGTYEVVLHIGTEDSGRYGWKYGSNKHKNTLYAVFTGGDQHLALRVTGYDIDYDDEVEVLLNGQSIGFLSVGANNANNAGDSFHITPEAQQAGPNLIQFKQRTSGFIWGVSKLLVEVDQPPLSIDTEALDSATIGAEYSDALIASNGVPPYNWQLQQGTLPPGITLGADGLIQGVPTAQGSYPFVVEVSDTQGTLVTRALSLDVIGAGGSLEISLTLGVADSGEYGRGFGSDLHDTQLDAHFAANPAGSDYLLSVIGFDIDSAQEVAVSINGTLLGYLSVGQDGTFNAGDVFEIPNGLTVAGDNTISFETLPGTETWGVSNMLLQSVNLPIIELSVGLEDPDQYGYGYGGDLHSIALVSTFDHAAGDLLLSLTGYDINNADEVEVLLNGNHIGYLSVGPAAEINSGDTFILPESLLTIGRNQILFQPKQSGQDWGVSNLLVAEVDPLDVVLTPGVIDTTRYGNKFGTNQHATELSALFSGTDRDLVLELEGYDIDYVDELALYLNGELLGYLRKGANNGYNGGDAFSIPTSVQQPGINELRFVVKTVGWKWGLRNLHLHDPGPVVSLSPGIADTGQYGNGYGSDEHPVEVVAVFDKPEQDVVINVVGYDIDYSDEVAVYFNDIPIGYLRKGANNASNSGDSFNLPLADQVEGQNEVRFVQSTGGMIWGVRSLLLSQ